MHGRLRARSGPLVARRHCARLQRQAAGTGPSPLRADHGRGHPPRPGDGGGPGQPHHQRPRGVHAGQRVHPRRVGRARVLARGRLLRPWHRRRGRHRPPSGELDRRGRTRARPVEDGHPPVRRGVSVGGVHARPLGRELRDLLRHPLSQRGAPGRPAAAHLADLRRPGPARCGLRREVGLGAPELVRAQRRRPAVRGSRGPRASPTARLGRSALVAGDPRGGPGDENGGGPLRRVVVREAGGGRTRRLLVPAAGGRQRHRPPDRLDRVHATARSARRDPGRSHRHAARARPVHARDRHRVRQPRRRLAALEAARETGRSRSATSRRRGCASGCGVRRPATSWDP